MGASEFKGYVFSGHELRGCFFPWAGCEDGATSNNFFYFLNPPSNL